MIKAIVKWLAAVTGAEADIRKSEREFIGSQFTGASYWFTNHTLYGSLYPFLMYLGLRVKSNFRVDGEYARETWKQIGDCKSLYDPEEGWNEFTYNDTTSRLQFSDWPIEEH